MKERKDVYKLPAGDTTLEWYAKAVKAMKKKPTTDTGSWNYQAAMHNFNPDSKFWKGAEPLPSKSDRKEFWDQCQHNSWFFLPWHRMYLAYFEQIVADTIVSLGGPQDWALPFWNYSDTSNPDALSMPSAFINPANSNNDLWIEGRRKSLLDAEDASIEKALLAPAFSGTERTSAPSFGGGESTPVNHGSEMGQLEGTPHGAVHIAIGGAMGDPDTAGLDPIFWLHHANIDRLWQVWLNQGNRVNPTKSAWIDTNFVFHDKEGKRVEKKCSDITDTTKIFAGYKYQDVGPNVPKLEHAEFLKIDFTMPMEIVAATNKSLKLDTGKTVVELKLTPTRSKKPNFLIMKEVDEKPQMTVLHFENITGKGVPPNQRIYLNVPDKAGDKKTYYAGSISFFGIEKSSKPGLHNTGSGLHISLDVSDLINKLRKLPNWNEKKLDVSFEPAWKMDKDASVKIGRISLYSE